MQDMPNDPSSYRQWRDQHRLTLFEEAELFAFYQEKTGLSQAKLAKLMRISRRVLQVRKSLLAAAPIVQDALRSGHIDLTRARAIATADTDRQYYALHHILSLREQRGRLPSERETIEIMREYLN